jgi:hypothetical protein
MLAGFAKTGAPLVDIPGSPHPKRLIARSCVTLTEADIGKQIVVAAEVSNAGAPIVIGIIQPAAPRRTFEVSADGHSVTLSANESIALKCGEASVTLSRDGKVVIRGKHVVTHASGVNRIRGGSVELN